jgi:predicted RNA-binding protein Jag
MSKESRKRRKFIIKLKQKRKKKIKKLREKYKLAKTEEEKRKIIEKALKINPNLTEEEFLKFIK